MNKTLNLLFCIKKNKTFIKLRNKFKRIVKK